MKEREKTEITTEKQEQNKPKGNKIFLSQTKSKTEQNNKLDPEFTPLTLQ